MLANELNLCSRQEKNWQIQGAEGSQVRVGVGGDEFGGQITEELVGEAVPGLRR